MDTTLPPPVARYLSAVRAAEAAIPKNVHLRQSGTMRTAPGKPWIPLEAEQWFSLDPPGFLWRGTIRPARLVRIVAADRFNDGHGSMRISAWGKIPMGALSGPEMDSAELLRFLVEGIWFPSFFVSPLVAWIPIDDHSAQVSIRIGEAKVSARMLFGADALLRGIEAQRYRSIGKRFELTPWRGRCDDYREANGVLVPHSIAVVWGLPQGEFEWLRLSIGQIEYS